MCGGDCDECEELAARAYEHDTRRALFDLDPRGKPDSDELTRLRCKVDEQAAALIKAEAKIAEMINVLVGSFVDQTDEPGVDPNTEADVLDADGNLWRWEYSSTAGGVYEPGISK
jgi:hypothetical protein